MWQVCVDATDVQQPSYCGRSVRVAGTLALVLEHRVFKGEIKFLRSPHFMKLSNYM